MNLFLLTSYTNTSIFFYVCLNLSPGSKWQGQEVHPWPSANTEGSFRSQILIIRSLLELKKGHPLIHRMENMRMRYFL